MFTRAVFLNMKPGCQAALARILEREVFALLQKESDFRGLVAFLGGTEALSLSLWDQRKSARADGGSAFTELTALSKVGLGPPSVEVFDISNSAFQAVEQMVGHEKAVGETPELRIFRVSDPIFQSVARTVPPPRNVGSPSSNSECLRPFACDDNQKASSPTADLPYLYDYRRPERRHRHHGADSLWDSYHVNLSRDLDWDDQIQPLCEERVSTTATLRISEPILRTILCIQDIHPAMLIYQP
jgi:hypothetical protein